MDTKQWRCQFIVNQPAEGTPRIVAQPSGDGTLEAWQNPVQPATECNE